MSFRGDHAGLGENRYLSGGAGKLEWLADLPHPSCGAESRPADLPARRGRGPVGGSPLPGAVLRGGSGVHSFDPDQPAAYPTRLEAGTLNSHGLAGLHAALEYLLAEGVENLYAREHALMRRFYLGVRDIPGVRIYGDFSAPCRAAIVSLNIRDLDSGEVSDALLQGWGIATRPGAHCAPRLHRALGTERQGIVRFSFSPFNTPQEIDTAVRAVADLAR